MQTLTGENLDYIDKCISLAGGKKRGFGFVQFSRLEQASSALKEMNTKPIKGESQNLLISQNIIAK